MQSVEREAYIPVVLQQLSPVAENNETQRLLIDTTVTSIEDPSLSQPIASTPTTNNVMKPDIKLLKQHLGYSSKLEIILCYLINIYYVYFIITNVAHVSQTSINPARYRHLKKGWIGDQNIDLTDTQWRLFRENLPLQVAGAIAYLTIAYLIKQVIKSCTRNKLISPVTSTNLLCFFYFLVSLMVEIYLYGTGITFMLFVLFANYCVGCLIYSNVFDSACIRPILGSQGLYHRYQRSLKCVLIWVYNLCVCYFILQYSQSGFFSFEHIFGNKLGLVAPQTGRWFDTLLDKKIHWKDTYRFMLLKCISFQMDQNYYHKNATSSDLNSNQNQNQNQKQKQAIMHAKQQQSSARIYRSLFDINYLSLSHDYNALKYFAYMLYYPLHIAGPIISYHDWMCQIKANLVDKNPYASNEKDVSPLTMNYKIIYLLRYILCFLCNEVMLHYCYTHLLSRFGYPMKPELSKYLSNAEISGNFDLTHADAKIASQLSEYVVGLGCFSYLHLNSIWLKFLLIWRFTRFFALLDGIVTVENMQRCITNSDSIVDFWKYWHSSFNLWNKRYIFIPLGGSDASSSKTSQTSKTSETSKLNNSDANPAVGMDANDGKKPRKKGGTTGRTVFNIILVFTFTALWHGDFNLSLIAWGAIMALAMIPEILVSNWFWSSKLEIVRYCRENERISRYVAACGGAVNISVLIFANEIGYGPGLKTMMHLFAMMFGSLSGMMLIVYSLVWFVVAVMCMFHLRYLEHHNIFNPLVMLAKCRGTNKGHVH